MDLTTPFISVVQLSLAPLVMAVVSILKMSGLSGKDNRWAPLLALVLGIGGAFLLPSATVPYTILAGVAIGCVAAGVYSGVKTTATPNP